MKLTLGWLYYDLMNTYGDRGNVAILKDRSEKRNIQIEVKLISTDSNAKDIAACDLFLMGGAEDRQQKIVSDDMVGDKEKTLKDKISNGTPGLYVCGAYQFLGNYYEAGDGTRIRCLNILPFYTKHPGTHKPRLVGDIVVQITNEHLKSFLTQTNDTNATSELLIGFENHGGRTYLNDNKNSLGTVLKGHGNNETDKLEGFISHNSIGTYMHGPLLPRNPLIADYLLFHALKNKYKINNLALLKDELTDKNRAYLLRKLGI